jgi:hypothetical protein
MSSQEELKKFNMETRKIKEMEKPIPISTYFDKARLNVRVKRSMSNMPLEQRKSKAQLLICLLLYRIHLNTIQLLFFI